LSYKKQFYNRYHTIAGFIQGLAIFRWQKYKKGVAIYGEME
jgi:hypothetical protein